MESSAYILYLETVSMSIANSGNEKYGANNEFCNLIIITVSCSCCSFFYFVSFTFLVKFSVTRCHEVELALDLIVSS